MNREIILEALRVHEDGIMQFTLGEVTVDEDGTIKCSDIYSSEWENHSEEIAVSIENILCSNIPLKPDMLVGIIVNEWFNYVGSDVEDLNYYGLLGVAIEIIDYIERYQCRDDNEQFEIIAKEFNMRKEFLDVVLSKRTMQEVCSHYCKKFVKDVKVEIGKPLKIEYLDGGSFTHETVLELNEDCDGFWIETTNKLWKFDYK